MKLVVNRKMNQKSHREKERRGDNKANL